LAEAFDASQDAVGEFRPDKPFGFMFALVDMGLNRGFLVAGSDEAPVVETAAGWEAAVWVTSRYRHDDHLILHPAHLVAGSIVECRMHIEICNGRLDPIRKCTKFFAAISLPAEVHSRDRSSGSELQSSCDVVPPIVAAAALNLSGTHRKTRRRAFDRSNLWLLIYRRHRCMIRSCRCRVPN
jgi:hypothetical protein